MNNEDIHNHTSEKEIRTFLSKQLRTCDFGSEFALELKMKQLETLKQEIESMKLGIAIESLIKKEGWDEWDISDDIPYNPETYFPFIGTETEFEELIRLIEEES